MNTTARNKDRIDFNRQLLQAKLKGIDGRNILKLGKSKGELKKVIGDVQILISAAVLKKSMQKDLDHIAEWHHFINLPDSINNPAAIFRSKTKGFVVLTEINNSKNKPLMVAIHLNKNVRITEIKSIYARNKTNTYSTWKKEGLLIYENKKSDLAKQILATIAREITKSRYKITKKQYNKKGLGAMEQKTTKAYRSKYNKELLRQLSTKHKVSIDFIRKSLAGTRKSNLSIQIKNEYDKLNTTQDNNGLGITDIEIKPVGSVACTIDAPQGAGHSNQYDNLRYNTLFQSV